MGRKGKNMGIVRKMLLIFVLVSILPIFIVQIVSYIINTTTIQNQTQELILANLEQSGRSVEDLLAAYDQVIMGIYTDSEYTKYLEAINVWESRSYYTARHELTSRLQGITYLNSDILGAVVVASNGDSVFYDSVTNSGVISVCFDSRRFGRDILTRDAMGQAATLYSGPMVQSDADYGDRNCFYIAHQLIDFNNYKKGPVGTVMLCVDESALSGAYYQGEPTDSNITFLINKQGDILSFPDKAYIGHSILDADAPEEDLAQQAKSFLQRNAVLPFRQMEVHILPVREGEFYILGVQDLGYTLKNVHFIASVIVLLGLLIAVISITIALTFSMATDRSMKRIIAGIDQMTAGDLGVQLEVEGGDEFARIARHFNDMSRRLDRANHHQRDALMRQKNAEIKSLEAQINPHFLYNTLDAMNWVALEREEFKLSQMLGSLASIMRYSIHRSNEIVTVREELGYIRQYIYLQQQRFRNSFQCVIHAGEEVQDCRIHKLLIQPLIENAILHGFPGGTGADEITIHIRKAGQSGLELVVADNGQGMEPELVEYFNHFDESAQEPESNIGVRNVISRVKLYYGAEGLFHITSDQGGTQVTIHIPFE